MLVHSSCARWCMREGPQLVRWWFRDIAIVFDELVKNLWRQQMVLLVGYTVYITDDCVIVTADKNGKQKC